MAPAIARQPSNPARICPSTFSPELSSKPPDDVGGAMRLTQATLLSLAVTGGLAVASVVPAAAQNDFQWRGRLSAGQAIEIKGINGDVSASPSSSGDVEVTASKSARRSNPAEVRIEVVPTSKGVTICAVYPDAPGKEPNRCAPGEEGRMSAQNNDTQVHFDVRVPAGVSFY